MSEKIQQFVLLWVFLWLVQRLVQSWASHPHSSPSKGSSTTRTTSYSLLATLQLRTTTTAAPAKALSTPLSQCFVVMAPVACLSLLGCDSLVLPSSDRALPRKKHETSPRLRKRPKRNQKRAFAANLRPNCRQH